MVSNLVSATLLALIACCLGTVFGASTFKGLGECECGISKSSRAPKIIGGNDCFEGEFPWMVSFKSKNGHFCGGFVVSDQHVLSAAHCFWPGANPFLSYLNGTVDLSSLNATLGEFTLRSKENVEDVTVPLEELLVHPNYDPVTRSNDIALVKLKTRISVHPGVKPVCLPESPISVKRLVNRKAMAAGWGKTDFHQDYYEWLETVDALKKVEVKIWDGEKCRKEYKGFNKFPSKGFLCAGKKGKDSCTGDSGSPLMLYQNNKWTAIGVVSVGKQCGDWNLPGVYTDVSEYLEWIESHRNPN